MGAQLKKDAIDLGIVSNNQEAVVAFYRDVLGFKEGPEIKFPGMLIRPLECGSSRIKIVHMKHEPATSSPPGGLAGATGLRYFTLWIANLDETLAACEAAGANVAVPVTDAGGGARICIVEDPDGNWVELIEAGG